MDDALPPLRTMLFPKEKETDVISHKACSITYTCVYVCLRVYVLKVNSNERAFVGESSSYSYEESVKYVLGDDVRKRYEKDFSSIDRREKIFRREQKRTTRDENFS